MSRKAFNNYIKEKNAFKPSLEGDYLESESGDYTVEEDRIQQFQNLQIFGNFPQERLKNNPAPDIKDLLDLFVHMGSKIDQVISDELKQVVYIGHGLHVGKTDSKFYIFDGRSAAIKNGKLVGEAYPLLVSPIKA